MQKIFQNTLPALRKLLQQQLFPHLPEVSLEKPSIVKVAWLDSLGNYKKAWNNLLNDQCLNVNKNDNPNLRASKTVWNFCVKILSIIDTAKTIPIGSGPVDTIERTAKEVLIAKQCLDLQATWGDFNPEQEKMEKDEQYHYPKITNEISLELARIIQGLCRELNKFTNQEGFSFISPEIDAIIKKDSQGVYDQVVNQLKGNLIGAKVTAAICRYLYVAPMFEIANKLEELYGKSLGKINRIAKQTIEALQDLKNEIECGVKEYSSKDKNFQQKLLEEYSPIPEDFDIFKARREVFAGQEGVKDVLLKLSDQLVAVVHEISERVTSQNVPQVLENLDSPTPALKVEVLEHSKGNLVPEVNENVIKRLEDDPKTNEMESAKSPSVLSSTDVPSASIEDVADLVENAANPGSENRLKIHKSERTLARYISKYESRSLLFKIRNPNHLNRAFQKLQHSYPEEKEQLREKLDMVANEIYRDAIKEIEQSYQQLMPEFFGEKGSVKCYLNNRAEEYEQSAGFFSRFVKKNGEQRKAYLREELQPALMKFCSNRNNIYYRQHLLNTIDRGIRRFKPRTNNKDDVGYRDTLKYLLEMLKNQIKSLDMQEDASGKFFDEVQGTINASPNM